MKKNLNQKENIKERNIKKILKQKRIWKKPEENLEPRREYEKIIYEKNSKPKKENYKRMHKKRKMFKYGWKVLSANTICTLFAQYVIGVFISVVSDCLNMKNIIFLLHNCIVRLDHLIKKFICFIFLCYICQKHISRNEIQCQAVFNKMSLRFWWVNWF